jgi:two-component system sensor histidine kinase UhpB
VGFAHPLKEGFGLRGIEERVRALGGEWLLEQRNGTHIIVKLPTDLQRTHP